MSSRGSVTADGHVPTTEYQTVKEVFDAKVLVGRAKRFHGLPDYSHSPNRIYIKEDHKGNLREMRIYGNDKKPVLEIAYHPEPKLSNGSRESVLHFHFFDEDLGRKPAMKITSEIKEKYKKYLEYYGLWSMVN